MLYIYKKGEFCLLAQVLSYVVRKRERESSPSRVAEGVICFLS